MTESPDPGGHFELFLNGQDFDVDAFVQEMGLEATQTWRRGERPCADSDEVFQTSGMKLRLGSADELSVDEQSEIALAFLQNCSEQLQRVGDYGSEMIAAIRLHHHQTEDALGELVGIPAPLVRLADAIGLEVDLFIEYRG